MDWPVNSGENTGTSCGLLFEGGVCEPHVLAVAYYSRVVFVNHMY